MIFVCDRSGPVSGVEVGLLNNPESEHRARETMRIVAAWNRQRPARLLKILTGIDDRFPVERWDAALFDLLPAAPDTTPAGPDRIVNGSVICAGRAPVQYLEDGTPFMRRFVSPGNLAPGSSELTGPHGIPGGIVSAERILHAQAFWTSTESGTTPYMNFGFVNQTVALRQIHISDTHVTVKFGISVSSTVFRIFVAIDYL